MTYLFAILIGVGAAVLFWRWRRWTRDDDGLGARLSDNWEARENDW